MPVCVGEVGGARADEVVEEGGWRAWDEGEYDLSVVSELLSYLLAAVVDCVLTGGCLFS